MSFRHEDDGIKETAAALIIMAIILAFMTLYFMGCATKHQMMELPEPPAYTPFTVDRFGCLTVRFHPDADEAIRVRVIENVVIARDSLLVEHISGYDTTSITVRIAFMDDCHVVENIGLDGRRRRIPMFGYGE